MEQLAHGSLPQVASSPPRQQPPIQPAPAPAAHHLVHTGTRADGRDPGTGIYRGRLAPSPTGYLHLGHARTFWAAHQRCLAARAAPPINAAPEGQQQSACSLVAPGQQAVLVLRNEDLDKDRAKQEFVTGFLEDLTWFGLEWQEGPDVGGPHGPYNQSERMGLYRSAFEQLVSQGLVYPCTCSRKDIQALGAPHAGDEVLYPGTCRPERKAASEQQHQQGEQQGPAALNGSLSAHCTSPALGAPSHEGLASAPACSADQRQVIKAARKAEKAQAQHAADSQVPEINGTGPGGDHHHYQLQHQQGTDNQPRSQVARRSSRDGCSPGSELQGQQQAQGQGGAAGCASQQASGLSAPPGQVQGQQQHIQPRNGGVHQRHDGQQQGPGHGQEQEQGASQEQHHNTGEHAQLREQLPCSQHHLIQQRAAGPRQHHQRQGKDKGRDKSRRPSSGRQPAAPKVAWRFKVPDGAVVSFIDNCAGPQSFTAGTDFGDFVVWTKDDLPSYQLSCVVDDAAMGITEVVRGADLLISTARQLLLARALGLKAPAYFHCPLVVDSVTGERLAKRSDSLSLRAMRMAGANPQGLREGWENGGVPAGYWCGTSSTAAFVAPALVAEPS